MTSSSDISLTSEEGAVELSGGVVLDTVMLPHGGGGYSVSILNIDFLIRVIFLFQGEVGQFQLCICMPSGLLFKVAIPTDNPTRPPQHQVSLCVVVTKGNFVFSTGWMSLSRPGERQSLPRLES